MKVRVSGALLLAALTVSLGAQEAPKSDDSYVPTYTQLPNTPLGEPNGEDPEARIEWMRERFAGDLTPEFTQLVINELAKEQLSNPGAFRWNGAVSSAAAGNWFSIGPTRSDWIRNGVRVTASDTGRIRTIVPHPTNANVLYLLTSSGGLWKTNDFLQPRPKWQPLTDGIYGANGGSAALGRPSPTGDSVYYGTGDPFDIGVGGLFYKSTNGGSTWSAPVALGASAYITDIKVDSSEAQDIVLVGTSTGLFRSTDAGATFTQIAAGVGQTFRNKRVWSLVRTSAGWLASAESLIAPTNRVGSLYVSTDKGATWNLAFSPAAPGEISRTTLGVGAPGDSVVYAFANGFVYSKEGVRLSFRQQDLFRSADGGLTWTALDLKSKTPVNPNGYQKTLDVMFDQPTYNQMLLVDPSDSARNTVYLGGQFSSVKSVDGGATWRVMSHWLGLAKLPYVHADFHAAAISTTSGQKTIMFGTDGGMFVSTDEGVSFSTLKNDGISSYMVYAMTSNAKNTDDVLIGLQDNGTRLRFGSGLTYNQVYGGDGFGVAWGQAGDTVSIGSLYYARMFRSPHNPPATQEKWEYGSTGITEANNPATAYFVSNLATPNASADPTGLVFYTRVRNKVYKTTNGARSWTAVWESPKAQRVIGGVPQFDDKGNPIMDYTRTVRAGSHPIGFSPETSDRAAILLNSAYALFTTDGGQTWTERLLSDVGNGGVAGWGFNSSVAYASNDVIYIGNENTASMTNRIIKSTDGGQTWSAVGTTAKGLPNVPVTKVLVSTKNPDVVYAATWIGVYYSPDAGATWQRYGNGLPIAVISDLYMPPDGNFLRASSYGRGVWEIR